MSSASNFGHKERCCFDYDNVKTHDDEDEQPSDAVLLLTFSIII